MPLIRKPGKDPAPPAPSAAATLAALTQGSADARWSAARAAAGIEGGADALAAALPAETDARVREAILTSLTRIASRRSVAAIIPLLRGDDAAVRTSALDALRAMPGAVRDYLPHLLHDTDADVRILSCEIVRGLPAPEATRILDELLAQESEVNVCAAAIDVLAEAGGPEALATLDRLAARFPDEPFLAFAIRVARERMLPPAAVHD